MLPLLKSKRVRRTRVVCSTDASEGKRPYQRYSTSCHVTSSMCDTWPGLLSFRLTAVWRLLAPPQHQLLFPYHTLDLPSPYRPSFPIYIYMLTYVSYDMMDQTSAARARSSLKSALLPSPAPRREARPRSSMHCAVVELSFVGKRRSRF